VPFALAHLGKPEVETLSTIFGGFLFGLVAWRSKSFLYAFLIHWFVATFTIYVAGSALP
jgi:membrane protease YdiL (CAAX protease family)